ncbi:ABC transporter ATP-binding protein [Saccharothrix algeriensis]|uniref:ABC transporter ATP-binding protein n=1 Tax=Saccharothrix algeriensis TaxID=173560 RepID=A0A8T8HYD4_9PSEU|nr:ABC transporter ATP-binding protein [Saccharothrix algeriensis]MBM7814468.1 ATP-binding cassette subfamily B protein [Saccharothrix algeriensis]QTR02764.1 ABC transporter ATP-binding protein [Saccharothrix algeriensis]
MTGVGEVLRERWRLLSLLPGAGRGLLAALLAAHLVTAVATALTAVVTGRLLDRALAGSQVGDVLLPLGAVAALVLAGQCAEIAREPLDLLAARRIVGALRARVRARVAEPEGIAHLGDDAYGTDLARVSESGGWRTRTPGTGAVGQLVLLGRLTGAVLCAAVLAWHAPLLAAWLLAVTLLMRATIRRQWVRLSATWDDHAGDRRRMEYWADTLGEVPAAKEVRLFGLGAWLTDRYRRQAEGWLDVIWRQRRGILRRQWWTFLLALVTGFAALHVPGAALAAGELGHGELVTMVLAAWGVFAVGAMGHEAFDIEYATGAVRAFDRLDRAPTGSAARGGAPAPGAAPHLRFDRVGFRYPGTDRPVLDGLDLTVRPGEVLAVVGRNGAGKTTLIKLLTGLLRPAEGRITLDGADLADFDVASWRRRVTAVFQDFVRYPLTLRENVALGAPEVDAADDAIRRAVEAAGGPGFLDRLPDGLGTLLTREHSGGVDLSGGQWQRIAIARALFALAHGRQVLVLDEPTAHLDVRAEAEFHERVIAAVPGATVILISHRLSAVRRADRIVVLDGGRITESGSHVELMARDGEYAGLYRLQAGRFAADRAEGVST